MSDKRILPALLFVWFLGFLAVHRFYVGKPGTALLFIITFGGLGIWWLVDMIMIIAGGFTDGSGKKVTQWT